MKAITLHRPWSWAIAHGGKDFENRSWKCPLPVGSELAIHSGKKWDQDAAAFIKSMGIPDFVDNPDAHPAGAIIAIAVFAGNYQDSKSPWFFGPWGWHLVNVLPITPIYCRGQQGLWVSEVDLKNVEVS